MRLSYDRSEVLPGRQGCPIAAIVPKYACFPGILSWTPSFVGDSDPRILLLLEFRAATRDRFRLLILRRHPSRKLRARARDCN
mgnify:CR=1 FL=1